MNVKVADKQKALIALTLFGIAMLGFTAYTLSEYFRYRGGEEISGIVADVDNYRSGGHRKYRATIEATIYGVTIYETVPLPRSGVSIGGLNVSSTNIHEGDAIDMLAVPSKDGYDMAIARVVRNPWPELYWELFILSMITFCIVIVVRKK